MHGPTVLTLARIIPADAGSTHAGYRQAAEAKDHPRGCGEHPWTAKPMVGQLGSSPRMRGAPELRLDAPDPHGIIPADAGSTHQTHHLHEPKRDHPRGCGEHDTASILQTVGEGSSPRMRGAQGGKKSVVYNNGIIPADAGSTKTVNTSCS